MSLLTILKNADLYAPTYEGCKHLLIGGGKILAISDDSIELPSNVEAEVIDLAGRKVFPGYIDCHTHVTGGGGEGGFASQVPPQVVNQYTNSGVTTVVGLLGTDDTTRSMANLLSRTYGLRQDGISAYCWTGGYHYPLTTLTGSAKTDIMYLDPVIGIGEFAISDHRSSQPTFEEVVRLASETHVAGLLSGKAGVIHFHLGDGARRLDLVKRAILETEIPARVFNPTHINRCRKLFDHACELLPLGMHADITATMVCDHSGKELSAEEAVLLALERGLPMNQLTISSDGGGSLPLFNEQGELTQLDVGTSTSLHHTVMQLVRAGADLAGVVLPLLTTNVADLLKLPSKGRLVEGNDADLLVIDESDRIASVMAMGKWHMRDGHQIVKGMFEK
jgi:beta-aspartyl-dipeptidase (metallo-type)